MTETGLQIKLGKMRVAVLTRVVVVIVAIGCCCWGCLDWDDDAGAAPIDGPAVSDADVFLELDKISDMTFNLSAQAESWADSLLGTRPFGASCSFRYDVTYLSDHLDRKVDVESPNNLLATTDSIWGDGVDLIVPPYIVTFPWEEVVLQMKDNTDSLPNFYLILAKHFTDPTTGRIVLDQSLHYDICAFTAERPRSAIFYSAIQLSVSLDQQVVKQRFITDCDGDYSIPKMLLRVVHHTLYHQLGLLDPRPGCHNPPDCRCIMHQSDFFIGRLSTVADCSEVRRTLADMYRLCIGPEHDLEGCQYGTLIAF